MNQETHDYCVELVKELIDGADAGDLSQPIIPDKYKWEHLLGLFFIKDELDGGEDLYREVYNLAIQSGENYLRQKAKSGERIKVVFQTYSAAQWPAEGVYRLFEKMPNVDVQIFVSPLADREANSREDTYRQTSNWFHERSYNVVDGMNIDENTYGGWGLLGGYPDVLYQLSSWYACLPRAQWFTQLPLRCLVAYIPYGFDVADTADGNYAKECVFNKDVMNMMWRVYCDSASMRDGYEKYQLLKGANVRFTGYAKMDYFYKDHKPENDYIKSLWKCGAGKDIAQMKKVIIAPHYTVFPEGGLCYSTFQKNLWFWLYLVKKYENRVLFMFKPHPNLRRASVRAGLFKDFEGYDKYIQAWNDCPNAFAVQEGSYLEYFATSDAMIMDSVSFLAEYLYTNKPMLFLTRPEQNFLQNGRALADVYYNVPGEDYVAIEQFIQDVVLEGNDTMAKDRKCLFEEEYDYYKINGQLASDFIVNEVKELIS
ncbi:CDP-Glycerol:Poly(glycerophosphate) glycerophosphotransferase [Lachnospiraceae bacterium XBD2001]|nr:CDP-Glycerol:Poly(glycerophosphate) glycerophosphotransferase [Lachnospiraceae bacterium XBD2001]